VSTASCEAFEIAMVRRAQGALPGDELEALEAHLRGCPSCRSYAASVQRIGATLSTIGERARAQVDWDELDRAVRREAKTRTRRLLEGVALGVACVLLALWGFGRDGERARLAVELTGTVGAIVGVKIALVLRELRRMAHLDRREDLFAAHRVSLARRIRRIEIARWLALVVVVVLAGGAVAHTGLPSSGRITWALLAAIVAGVWTRTMVGDLPRMRRELTSLDANRDAARPHAG
jgi:hypothetical protein